MNTSSQHCRRVCIVVENHPSRVMGGAQFQAHLLAKCFAERSGVEVTYLARRVDDTSGCSSYSNYRVLKMGSDRGIRRRAVFFDVPDLHRALSNLKPDLIYQRMRQSYTAGCARYAKRLGVPFFFHIASDMDLERSIAPERWVSFSAPFRMLENALGIWGMDHAGYVIAQNSRQSCILKRRTGCPADLIVPNFQPLPDQLPKRGNDHDVRVFWLANFKEVKRPEHLYQLASMLRDEKRVRFTVAGRVLPGSGYASTRDALSALPNVDYIGEIGPAEVAANMGTADFHLSTSLVEGFPNTFIEAWGNGAVVLSLNVDPVDGGMEAAGVGRVCEGSLDRAKSIILDALGTKEPLQGLRDRAFKYVHKKHSLRAAHDLVDHMLSTTVARPTRGVC